MDIITLDGKNYKRIYKQEARRLHKEGYEILVYMINANPYSMWNQPFTPDNTNMYSDVNDTFDIAINRFEYYNAGNGYGYYAKYYISTGYKNINDVGYNRAFTKHIPNKSYKERLEEGMKC